MVLWSAHRRRCRSGASTCCCDFIDLLPRRASRALAASSSLRAPWRACSGSAPPFLRGVWSFWLGAVILISVSSPFRGLAPAHYGVGAPCGGSRVFTSFSKLHRCHFRLGPFTGCWGLYSVVDTHCGHQTLSKRPLGIHQSMEAVYKPAIQ